MTDTRQHDATRQVGDALDRQVFHFAVSSIVDELEINITRTAYSLLIQEAQDYCVALLTPDFKTFAHSQASIPIFVTDMGEPVQDCVNIIGVENLADGDVFVTNCGTGQHLNNCTMATPLFHGDRLTGYLAIRAHWADLGGLVPGGQSMAARTIFQEGTRLRGLRVMRRGKIEPEVLATIQANTYQVDALTGDLMSQLAACRLGARRWAERIVAQWSGDDILALTAMQFAASERYARDQIAALADGTYTAEQSWTSGMPGLEFDLRLAVKVVVTGDKLICDLSGLPPQTHLPINAGRIGGAVATIRLAFRYLLAGDAPTDSGLFEPLEIVVPDGTILSAQGDAPMGFWNAVIPIVIDLFIQAIARANPDVAPAAHFASNGGVLLDGKHADGTTWRMMEAALGGLGAERGCDGYGPVKALFLGNMRSVPVELTESRCLIRYHQQRLDRSAGGAGLHRGGPSVDRIFELLGDANVHAYPPPSSPALGIAGGRPGKLGFTSVKLPGGADWTELGALTKTVAVFPAGTMVRQFGGGGGGWGEPCEEESPLPESGTMAEEHS